MFRTSTWLTGDRETSGTPSAPAHRLVLSCSVVGSESVTEFLVAVDVGDGF